MNNTPNALGLTPAQQQSWNNFWNGQAKAVQREQADHAHGPGDGVTTCKDCGYKLTELFMSKACDRCDGLLKPEPAEAGTDEIAYTLMFERVVRGLRRVDLTGNFSSSSWADIETFAKNFSGSHLVVLKHNKSNSRRIHAIWTEDARQDTSDVLIHDMVTI